MRFALFLSGLISVAAVSPLLATSNYTAPSSTLSQDFNSLITTGTAAWSNNSTLGGWYVFNAAGTAITGNLTAGTGSSNAGGLYSFGVAGTNPVGDRALGTQDTGAFWGSPAAGSPAGHLLLGLVNTTGAWLNSVTVTYDGEQWRRDNATAQSTLFDFNIGLTTSTIGGTGITTSANWTSRSALNFSSPNNSATALALDGNASGNRTAGITDTFSVSWPAGQTLWLRWTGINNTGNDHGLAIDNVSFTAVPEPSAYAALAGLAALGLAWKRRRRS